MPLNRIDMTRGLVEEGEKGSAYGLNSLSCPERKVTRRLKKKYEINYIQKVGSVFV